MAEEEFSDREEKEGEKDIYTDEGAETLFEEDSIKPEEYAFMRGYELGEKLFHCANCGKELYISDFVEKKVLGKTIGNKWYAFCSEKCMEKFETKKR